MTSKMSVLKVTNKMKIKHNGIHSRQHTESLFSTHFEDEYIKCST